MHTSYLTLSLFWGAMESACLAQTANYYSSPKPRPILRTCGLYFGWAAAIFATIAGWRANIDWATLPMSDEGLTKGQLWNNSGIPAIAGTYGPDSGK